MAARHSSEVRTRADPIGLNVQDAPAVSDSRLMAVPKNPNEPGHQHRQREPLARRGPNAGRARREILTLCAMGRKAENDALRKSADGR